MVLVYGYTSQINACPYYCRKAYLPINPRLGADAISKIIELSRVQTLIVGREHGAIAKQNVSIVDIEACRHGGSKNLNIPLSGFDTCCVMHTSGSTGVPKGVCHTHRNVLHTVEGYRTQLNVNSADTLLLLAPSSFVAGMLNSFASLSNGATVCIFDPVKENLQDLPSEMISAGVTVVHMVPSIYQRLVDLLAPSGTVESVRLVWLAGEAVQATHFKTCKRHFPNAKEFVVVYGLTEAVGVTFYSTSCEQDAMANGFPIGFPVQDFSIHIVDDQRNVLPRGEFGEIVITSEYVSTGYHNDPKLTRESFATHGEQRSFYTGDLGYLDEHGCLFHAGRKDSVFKISGQKVSLQDVEKHLMAYDHVREAAVIPHWKNDQALVAYVVADEDLDEESLRTWLLSRISEFMIPAHIIPIDSIPLNLNGKVDRKTLATFIGPTETAPESPSNALEEMLAEVWRCVLKRSDIGIHDNFFDFGGNSLLAMMICNRIGDLCGADIRPSAIFRAPTIRQFSTHLEKAWGFDLLEGT